MRADVDEYVAPPDDERAATMRSSRSGLTREFPGEQFLIVRFGDHQPAISADGSTAT